MDRQDVEYIERDFDEEFDEFGRKKKKRRLHDEVGCILTNILFISRTIVINKKKIQMKTMMM